MLLRRRCLPRFALGPGHRGIPRLTVRWPLGRTAASPGLAPRARPHLAQRRVEIRTEFAAGRVRRRSKSADYDQCARRKAGQAVTHQMPQAASDPMSDHRIAHGFAHDKTHPGRRCIRRSPGGCATHLRSRRAPASGVRGVPPRGARAVRSGQYVHHEAGPSGPAPPPYHQAVLVASGESGSRGKHAARSGSQTGATLTAARGHDGPAGAGVHAHPETMLLRPTAVVRLVSALALAHGRISRLRLGRWPRRATLDLVRFPVHGFLRRDTRKPVGIPATWVVRSSTRRGCSTRTRGLTRGYAGVVDNRNPGWANPRLAINPRASNRRVGAGISQLTPEP